MAGRDSCAIDGRGPAGDHPADPAPTGSVWICRLAPAPSCTVRPSLRRSKAQVIRAAPSLCRSTYPAGNQEPGSDYRWPRPVRKRFNRNWQRLILTHLTEREHLGVLAGAPLTDIKMTLVAGRAHLKHTEGGDFRQATYRAIRQGLMEARAESVAGPRRRSRAVRTPQGSATADCWNRGIGSGSKCQQT